MHSYVPEPGTDRLTDPFEGIDPRFVFDFQSYGEPDDDRQRWSTWLSVEPLCRGPESGSEHAAQLRRRPELVVVG